MEILPVGCAVMKCSSSQLPTGLADGLGLESALSGNGIRPDFLGPPHPGVRDLGFIFTIFLPVGIVKMYGER